MGAIARLLCLNQWLQDYKTLCQNQLGLFLSMEVWQVHDDIFLFTWINFTLHFTYMWMLKMYSFNILMENYSYRFICIENYSRIKNYERQNHSPNNSESYHVNHVGVSYIGHACIIQYSKFLVTTHQLRSAWPNRFLDINY